jgi:HEAT repeat protein
MQLVETFRKMFAGNDALAVVAVGVVVLTAIVLLLSIVVLAHHMITDRQRRLNRQRFESASVLLAPRLVSGSADLEKTVEVTRGQNGDRAVALVLRRARYDLTGPIVDRISAILDEMGEVDKLVREARSRREWRRIAAVRALGECGGPKAREALVAASKDPSGEVRRTAREGLLNDRTPEAIRVSIQSFLIDLPRRAGWRRSFYARLAAVAADQLTELIESSQLTGGEEKLALEALGDAGRPSALTLALARVASKDPEARATAIRVLGKVGGLRELPLVIEALNDQEWFVRAAAARALEWTLTLAESEVRGDIHDNACRRLEQCLTDRSWWVRANAARALSRAGAPGVQALLEVADSDDRYARDAAIAALAMAPLSPDVRLAVRRKVESITNVTPLAPVAARKRGDLFA